MLSNRTDLLDPPAIIATSPDDCTYTCTDEVDETNDVASVTVSWIQYHSNTRNAYGASMNTEGFLEMDCPATVPLLDNTAHEYCKPSVEREPSQLLEYAIDVSSNDWYRFIENVAGPAMLETGLV